MPEEVIFKVAVIVEDQPLQDYIVMLLVGEGYDVKPFSNQTSAIETLEKEFVDLIISEFHSANINGLDICKVLRKNFLYNLIPMFFLIPDEEPLNAAKLIFAGADDYIKKSQAQDELFLKIKLIAQRTSRQYDINVITRLPGSSYLLKELQKRIDSKKQFAVSYLELYKFKEFTYRYGIEKGDTFVKHTAELIYASLRKYGETTDFISHLHNNEFIFVTSPERVDTVVSNIIAEFDKSVADFYEQDDKMKGYIVIKNRQGQMQKLSFLRLRIGVVVNSYLAFFNPTRILQIAAEIKDTMLYPTEKSMSIKEEGRGYVL